MQQADAEAQLRFFALRVDFESLREGVGRFLPAAQLLIADAEVEIRGRVTGSQREQLLVGLDRVVELFQLELDVALGGEYFGRFLAVLDGGIQLAQRFLALSFQVQRDRLRQCGRYRLARGAQRRICSVLTSAHGCQLPFVDGML